jgi:subtilisin family serine protease
MKNHPVKCHTNKKYWMLLIPLLTLLSCKSRHFIDLDPEGIGRNNSQLSGANSGTEQCNWHIDELNFPSVWKSVQERTGELPGKGIRVALLDTGIAMDHPELEGANIEYESGYDFVRRKSGADYEPLRGTAFMHGTLTAATLVSRRKKGSQLSIIGVAPEVTLIPIRASSRITLAGRIFQPFMGEAKNNTEDFAKAIKWAVDRKADIIGIAMGTPYSQTLESATRYATDRGVVVIATTGHSLKVHGVKVGPTLFPGKYSHVIGVSGSTVNEKVWNMSSPTDGADIAAPAFPMCWTNFERDKSDPEKLLNPHKGIIQVGDGGTSFSTTITVGSVALWMAYVGRQKIEQYKGINRTKLVKYILQKSAKRNASWPESGFGAGVLNPLGMLEVDLPAPENL